MTEFVSHAFNVHANCMSIEWATSNENAVKTEQDEKWTKVNDRETNITLFEVNFLSNLILTN